MAKKIKITVVENGFDKEVEIEVPDEAGSWQKPEQMRVVSTREPRLDGVEKVTGRAKYAMDVRPPGMLWARVLRAPYGRARLESIDLDAAKKVPGFAALSGEATAGKTYNFAGQPVLAIAAESEEAADDVLHALQAKWKELPALSSLASTLNDREGNAAAIGEANEAKKGDPDAAMQSAAARVQGRYQVPTQHHVCLEPHGNTIAPDYDGKKLMVWATTQTVTGVHNDFVKVSGLPGGDVEVICEYMGGGFGSKFGIGAEGRFAWELSKQTGKPVQLLMDRKDEFRAAGNRPGFVADVKMAADAQGKLTAFDIDNYGANEGGCRVPYVYQFENQRVAQRAVKLNANGPVAFRAPGHPEASFFTESLVDEIAYQLKLDPLEWRKQYFAGDEKRLRQFALGEKALEWSKYFQKTPGAMAGPRKIGVGMAVHTWGGGGSPSTPVTVRIHPNGSVEALTGSQDLGTGTRTIVAMIVAEELGLDTEDINVKIGRRSYGPAGGSGGSTTAPSVSPAAKMAGLQARLALFQKLAPVMGVAPDALEIRNRKIQSKDGSKVLAWKDATVKLGLNPIEVKGQWVPGLSSSGVAGCGFARVEVDVETGKLRVAKYVAVQDSGLVINRTTWESQVVGGVLQGLGYATLEERVLDPDNGGFLNANLLDYKVPMAREVPDIEVILDHEPERGVIGIGEPPIISPGAAIANAVYNATGVRVRQLPITPDKFLMAKRQTKSA